MSHPRITKERVRRGVHKSTGGILPAIPRPVDPVDAAPPPLTSRTVALFRVLLQQAVVGPPAHQLGFGRERREDKAAPAEPLPSLPDAP
jgi:hypothetical protein